MVSTPDSESGNPSSSLGRTSQFYRYRIVMESDMDLVESNAKEKNPRGLLRFGKRHIRRAT